ncbi:MAG TPA: gfo/Idh/MocA family oxidoreductase, partial [Planctomycetaceae bacterium]|nr:gfo/Idh/MocA family oxidoreductase [Planctomycetaceae bacterium]
MPYPRVSRRQFLATTAAAGGGYWLGGSSQPAAAQEKPRAKVERLGVGSIGLRYQGTVDTHKAAQYGDIVAVCDVDRHVRDQAKASFGSTPRHFEDYRDLLARPDVDVV